MKLYRLLLLCATAAIMAACAKDPMDGLSPKGDGRDVLDGDDIVPGWVRIKLAENAQPLTVGAFTRGAACSGDADMDRLAADLGATEIRRVFTPNKRFEARHRKHGLHLWFDIKVDEAMPVSRAQNALETLPIVEHVQPIYKIYMSDGSDYLKPSEMWQYSSSEDYAGNQRTMPFNDPDLNKQWHYDNDGSIKNSIAGADIKLFKAWEELGKAGDPSIIINVVDNGLDVEHEDLVGNIWINEAEKNGQPGVDDDGNGKIDDIYGWNYGEGSEIIVKGSHGTHVSGTIAAVNNNGIGVCGVAGGTGNNDGVKIMMTQIFNNKGESTGDSRYVDCYVYAADNGAVISQNSWNQRNSIDKALSAAFDYFIEEAGTDENGNQIGPMKGGVIIFSPGNLSLGTVAFPATDDRVICVVGMRPDYLMASYSCFGKDADVFAPGGKAKDDMTFGEEAMVYSTDVNNTYSYLSGTSMACPHVTGVAALIVANYGGVNTSFTNEDLKDKLLKSTRKVGHYQTTSVVASGIGRGLIDASLIAVENPNTPPEIPGNVKLAQAGENQLAVSFTIPADGNTSLGMEQRAVESIVVSYAIESDVSDPLKWRSDIIANRLGVGEELKYTITNLEDETVYHVKVKSIDRFGNESEYSQPLSLKTPDHVNRAPKLTAAMLPVTLDVESETALRIDLSKYFSDEDLPNDKLTFTCNAQDTTVVKALISDEHYLDLWGLRGGKTTVSVAVTDLAGASASSAMAVTSISSVNTPPVLVKEFEPLALPGSKGEFTATFNLNDYFTDIDGDALSFNAVSNNVIIAKATVSGSRLTVTGLSNGTANVTVTANDSRDGSVSAAFDVDVTKGQGGSDASGTPQVESNPVADNLTITMTTSSTQPVGLEIYDAASRLVTSGQVTFSQNKASLDVSKLSPGMYMILLNVDGKEHKLNFVKK